MKVTRVIPLLLVVFLLLTIVVKADYPDLPSEIIKPQECSLYVSNDASRGVLVACHESLVISGIYIVLNTTDYNVLWVYRASGYILFNFYYDPSVSQTSATKIDLPIYELYSNTMVYGFYINLSYYYPEDNATYTYNLTYTYNTRLEGYTHIRPPNMRPFEIEIKAITYKLYTPIVNIPSPEENWSPPEWWDIIGWIEYLLRLLGIFVQGLGVGIYTVALMIAQLIALTPYLVLLIPLHVITSFLHSPISGLKTIRFYLELGRKLYDLFIKVVQAIAQFIQAIKPV